MSAIFLCAHCIDFTSGSELKWTTLTIETRCVTDTRLEKAVEIMLYVHMLSMNLFNIVTNISIDVMSSLQA